MDGNGRWAKKRRLPRIEGHRRGAQNVTPIVEAASKIGIKYLTLFTFSVENWRRPESEVSGLMDLFEKVLAQKLPDLMKNDVRLNIIGNLSDIRESTRKKFEAAINKTDQNKGMLLTIALNYSGRDDIIRAVNKIISKKCHPEPFASLEGKLREGSQTDSSSQSPQNDDFYIDENNFSKRLDTKDLPDPELLIRTSGEQRISNFLLWQIAYSEIYFSDTLWPDFRPQELYDSISDYQKRERRFGGL